MITVAGGLPPIILSVAMAPFFTRQRGKRVLLKASEGAEGFLHHISKRDFKLLVREYFQYRGFAVAEMASGTIGGIDLTAVKEREKYFIFCRQKKSGDIGPAEVKELSRVNTAGNVTGIIIVASAEFTSEAISFTPSNGCILMGGKELLTNICSLVKAEGVSHSAEHRLVNTTKWGLTTVLFISVFIGGSLLTDWGNSSFTTLKEAIREHMDWQWLPWEEEKPGKQEVEPVRFRYELKLNSGAVLYSDNVEVTEERVSYTESNGLKVTIDRDEIQSLKRIRLDNQVPQQKGKGVQ